jgi:hypothetical protein
VYAAPDLFVGREADAQLAVRDLRVRQQMPRHRHDDGDAGLVVGAEQRRPAGGHDVVADLVRQVGRLLGREHLRRVVGQHDVAAVIVAMDERLDAAGVEAGAVSTCARKPMVARWSRWWRGWWRAPRRSRSASSPARRFPSILSTSRLSRSNWIAVLGDVVDFRPPGVDLAIAHQAFFKFVVKLCVGHRSLLSIPILVRPVWRR